MDNLTHSFAGWALGQAGLKRKTRKGLAALVLGANMPDIDVFFGWVAWEPLATHRGFTHGVVAAIIMPPMLAGLLWLLDRWQVRRGTAFPSGLSMHFGWLVALCYLGALTHPLLDWQTTYSVQLLSPFSDQWFHADTLFIIDVWIWTGLALAIWLSRKRERDGGSWQRPAQIGLLGLCGYLAFNSVVSGLAKDAARSSEPYAAPDTIYASPPPVLFWQRELAWRQGREIAWGDYSLLANPVGLTGYTAPMVDNMADPTVLAALRDPAIVAFARWSTLPFATVDRAECAATVRFGDARYGRGIAGNRFSETVTVPIAGAGC